MSKTIAGKTKSQKLAHKARMVQVALASLECLSELQQNLKND